MTAATQSGKPGKKVAKGRREVVWDRAEPFPEGNELSTTHGAFSSAKIEPRARELVPTVLEVNTHLDRIRDGAAIVRYCVGLARIERVYEWLAERGDVVFEELLTSTSSAKASPHGIYERLERWERQAAKDEERLAIAPLTRARLGLDQLEAESRLAKFKGNQGEDE